MAGVNFDKKEEVTVDDLLVQMRDVKKKYFSNAHLLVGEDGGASSGSKRDGYSARRSRKSSIPIELDFNGTCVQTSYSVSQNLPAVECLTISTSPTRNEDNNTLLKEKDYCLNRTLSAPTPMSHNKTEKKTISVPTSNEIMQCTCDELHYLRHSHRKLERDVERLQNANSSYRGRLAEEMHSRQRMEHELNELKTKFGTTAENIVPRQCGFGLSGKGIGGPKKDHSCESIEKSDEENNIYHLRMRNRELERELKAAKRTIKAHEKKLLLFSHLFNNNNPSAQINNHPNNRNLYNPHRTINLTASPSTPHNYNNNNTIARRKGSLHDDFVRRSYEAKKYDEDLYSIGSSSTCYFESTDVKPR